MNDSFLKHISDNPITAPRIKTDSLFMAQPSEQVFGGEAKIAMDFIEKAQLLDEKLWELFVNQYRIKSDVQDEGWRCEYWGKMMRGACWTYRCTKNEKLYSLLLKTIEELMSLQEESGRISTYDEKSEFNGWDMWGRKYVLLGMQYFYEICKDEGFKARLLSCLKAQADYIIQKIGDGEGQKDILKTTPEWCWGGTNSASILEPFVRLYSLTKEQKYLDFASYVIKSGGCAWGDLVKTALSGEKMPFEYPVTKAYETMSFFEGLIEYYRISGEEKLKTAFLNFVDGVIASDLTIIGSCGCTHELFDNSTIKQTEPSVEVMQETCVSVTWMKICFQALRLTGDAKYADCIETTYYNAFLGSINFAKNACVGTHDKSQKNPEYAYCEKFLEKIGGFPFDSYSPLYKSRRNRKTGGYKEMENGTAYGCCACIGSAGSALFPLSAILLSKRGFVINQYISGNGIFNTPQGNEIFITIQTNYPYEGEIKIDWNCENNEEFALDLRIPSFVDCIKIDGKMQKVTPNSYLSMTVNSKGSLVMELPLLTQTVTLNGKVAIKKGSLVFAADERNQDVNVVVSDNIKSEKNVQKDFDCRQALEVEFSNGAVAKLTDYASAGAEWNCGKTLVTAWLDKA